MLVRYYEVILVEHVLCGKALLHWGKWTTQVSYEIAQVFGQVLVAHLVKVIATLFVWHDDLT